MDKQRTNTDTSVHNRIIRVIVNLALQNNNLCMKQRCRRKVQKFAISQSKNLSLYYRLGVKLLAYTFIIYRPKLIYKKEVNLDSEEIKRGFKNWIDSKIPMLDTLYELYEKLAVFAVYSEIFD